MWRWSSRLIAYLMRQDTPPDDIQRFERALTTLERRQLETEILTTELEARVAILEGEHADDRVA